jgi:hypothetical protein
MPVCIEKPRRLGQKSPFLRGIKKTCPRIKKFVQSHRFVACSESNRTKLGFMALRNFMSTQSKQRLHRSVFGKGNDNATEAIHRNLIHRHFLHYLHDALSLPEFLGTARKMTSTHIPHHQRRLCILTGLKFADQCLQPRPGDDSLTGDPRGWRMRPVGLGSEAYMPTFRPCPSIPRDSVHVVSCFPDDSFMTSMTGLV